MKRLPRAGAVSALWIVILLLAGCGGDDGGAVPPAPAPAVNPFADYTPDPDTYSKPPSPAKLLTVTGPNGPFTFPSDQIFLLMKTGTARSAAVTVAAAVGGTIVGQVPAIGFYQLEIAGASSQQDLDTAITTARLDPNVDDASYNVLTTDYAKCPPLSDLEGLALENRCPFSDIGYYTALTIFEEIRPSLTLNTVRVAVIDSGIQANNGEFDKVSILNLDSPGTTPTDSGGHGTSIAGVIAADDDQGVNGLASRFLRDRLQLLWGGASDATADRLVAVKRAADAKARVVNMSFGYTDFSTAETPRIRAWKRLLATYPAVLFVAAAPNKPVQLKANMTAPAGIQGDNVITVGGTALCKPLSAWSGSAYGPLIDIAAPAEKVPKVGTISGHVYTDSDSGNSLAAPQVTSLAAILFSLKPDLTPKQVKNDYITKYTFLTHTSLGGGRRLSLPLPLEQLLIDLTPSVSQSVLALIDNDSDGTWDEPGLVANRICGGLRYSVQGFGTHSYNAGKDKTWIWGVLNPTGFLITTPAGLTLQEALLTLNCVTCSFQVGASFAITSSAVSNPGTAEMGYTRNQATLGSSPFGTALSGSWKIDSCRIEERDPLFNDPMWVEVKGSFGATLDMLDPGVTPPLSTTAAANGYFGLLFSALHLLGSSDPMLTYLETNCAGGIP